MQADDQRAFHIQKIRQHPVIQLRRENLQKRNSPVFFTHTELLAGAELEAGRRDEILGGQTGRSQPSHSKRNGTCSSMWKIPWSCCHARLAVQGLGGHTQALEVVQDVGLNALQGEAWRLLRLSASIPKVRYLVLIRPLLPFASWFCSMVMYSTRITVKIIPLERNVDGAGKGLLRGRKVQKGQLKLNGAVEVVEEIAPALKDRRLVSFCES